MIVVVGGSGFYGRYLVEDLLHRTDAPIVVVARRPGRSSGRVQTVAADHHDVATLTRLVADAAVVVHCAGPFQAMPLHPLGPLRAALVAGVPYVDISEDRAFCRAALELAERATAPVLTGASVVPGMQALAVADLTNGWDDVVAVRCAAAPDTRRHRGDAMFRAMLHGAGLGFVAPRDGAPTLVHGWSEPEWVRFPPPLGRRLVYQVYEMADLDVLVEQCGAGTVSFKAGSEFAWLNRTLAVAAAARARFGRPRHPERFTSLVRGFSWLLGRAGDEAGGFMVEVSGHVNGGRITRAVGMTAVRAGGRIPALLAAIAVEEVLAGRLTRPGATSLSGWLPAERMWAGLQAREVTLWHRDDAGAWRPR